MDIYVLLQTTCCTLCFCFKKYIYSSFLFFMTISPAIILSSLGLELRKKYWFVKKIHINVLYCVRSTSRLQYDHNKCLDLMKSQRFIFFMNSSIEIKLIHSFIIVMLVFSFFLWRFCLKIVFIALLFWLNKLYWMMKIK